MRLETERLVIRSAVAADAPSLQRLFSDPEVRRYLPPGEPSTIGEFIGSVALQKVERTGPEVELAYHYLPSA
jgi:RimJ/RimL family protein N-acetyltransferase